ncbi:hypothetical protein [Nocardia seriolae]|uniref:Uncharacterized protein n=1 Tax=Nocardia seriolae TaxID=37332 RepID=A0A0B8MZT5_9NOCA|nr:hypothetical protein [Nocardia seriolae]APA99385.1 hypothetical protein NS506_05339 [Nocardia seriolae]MTJ63227.1 hypothetical protein [Nocardia seriolae]MTJ72165.1 hypothetical protein [Nocardia seriolae]MTJ88970.1 hypothetical protein [Nocardia seriolae]MTK32950.1 hypothetical protein [Nocardia seriolae]
MHFEEFRAVGALDEEIAADLADVASRYGSYVTISCHGRTVHALVLPMCWDVLQIRAGDLVTVITERGHRPSNDEDRRALQDFVDSFHRLTTPRRAVALQ